MPLQDPALLRNIIDASMLKTALGIFVSGLLGLVGGIAAFFYEVDNGRRKFTWFGMLSMSLVAFVSGAIAGEMIPVGDNYYGLTMAVGVNAYPFFGYVRRRFLKLTARQGNGR